MKILDWLKEKLNNWLFEKETITIGEFHKKFSKSSECEIYDSESDELKFIEYQDISNLGIYVESENNTFIKVNKSLKTVPYEVWDVDLEDDYSIKCADRHIFMDMFYNEVFCQDLKIDETAIRTRGGNKFVKRVINTGVKENMFDLELSENSDHTYYTNDILSHNTTTSSAFMLFYTIFNKDKTVAIVANKQATSKEILDRIKLMYDYLPMWLKPGVLEWNKTNIKFDNGCKIIAAATSADSIRGQSISCVDGDTIITVKSDITGIEDLTISEFSKRLVEINNEFNFDDRETLQTIITNTGDCKPSYQVLTPNGFSDLGGVVISHCKKTIKLKDYNIICTPDHLIKIGDIFVKAGSLSHEEYNNCQDVYDLMNVDKNNEYFTNGIVSHNCLYLDEFAFIPKNFINEFIESTFPVISASKLARIIITSTPNGKNHFYKFYEEAEKGKSDFKHSHIKWSDMPGRDEAWRQARIKELGSIEKFNQEYGAEFADASNMAFKPDTIRHIEQVQVEDCLFEHVKTAEGLKIFQRPIKNRKYLISCDVAGGAGRDSSTMVVIDITTDTFNIVSTYQSDEISTKDYPAVIYNLALYYNNAFILIENNGMGDGVANELWYNLEYNNIYSADFTKEFRFKKVYHKEIGIKTNKKNKKAGVLFLSSMLDKFQIIIPDIRIVDELYTFCKNDNGSYSASSGNHDDFVMNLVLFAYVYKDKDRFEVLKSSYDTSDLGEDERGIADGVFFIEGGKNNKSKEDLNNCADKVLLELLSKDKSTNFNNLQNGQKKLSDIADEMFWRNIL